jgi:hypothetical protein
VLAFATDLEHSTLTSWGSGTHITTQLLNADNQVMAGHVQTVSVQNEPIEE